MCLCALLGYGKAKSSQYMLIRICIPAALCNMTISDGVFRETEHIAGSCVVCVLVQ